MSDEQRHIVTKDELLSGTKNVHEIETRIGVFRVRPLNYTERAHAEAMAVRGMSTKVTGTTKEEVEDATVDVDAEKTTKCSYQSNAYILARAFSIPGETEWAVDEIDKIVLPDDVKNQLLREIYRISGLKRKKKGKTAEPTEEEDAEELRNFREESEGS